MASQLVHWGNLASPLTEHDGESRRSSVAPSASQLEVSVHAPHESGLRAVSQTFSSSWVTPTSERSTCYSDWKGKVRALGLECSKISAWTFHGCARQ